MRLPPPLSPGDVVRIVAPAGPFDPEPFEKGLAVLRAHGLVPRYGRGLSSRARYLAGSDERRLAEWNEALADKDARAIWAARGGYGTMRILDRIDPRALARNPRFVVGFSDLTAIHAVLNRAGLVTVHGPVVTQLGRATAPAVRRLFDLVLGRRAPAPFRRLRRVRPGHAEGPLYGGNLTLLAHLAGTAYLPSLEGAVLLVEDIAESPYRLDRAFQSLRLAGVLDGIAGVVIGHLTRCDDDKGGKGRKVLEDLFGSLGVPVVSGAPVGHEDDNHAVLLGAPVRLDATKGILTP